MNPHVRREQATVERFVKDEYWRLARERREMFRRPLPRLAHAAPDRAALPAGADAAVADDPHRVDGEQLVTLAQPDGPHLDVMGHE